MRQMWHVSGILALESGRHASGVICCRDGTEMLHLRVDPLQGLARGWGHVRTDRSDRSLRPHPLRDRGAAARPGHDRAVAGRRAARATITAGSPGRPASPAPRGLFARRGAALPGGRRARGGAGVWAGLGAESPVGGEALRRLALPGAADRGRLAAAAQGRRRPRPPLPDVGPRDLTDQTASRSRRCTGCRGPRRRPTPHQLANVIQRPRTTGATWRRRSGSHGAKNGRHNLAALERAMELHRMGSAGTRSGAEDAFLRLDAAGAVVNMHLLGREVDFHGPGRRGRGVDGMRGRPWSVADDAGRDATLAAADWPACASARGTSTSGRTRSPFEPPRRWPPALVFGMPLEDAVHETALGRRDQELLEQELAARIVVGGSASAKTSSRTPSP